jgi:hypothetical protein
VIAYGPKKKHAFAIDCCPTDLFSLCNRNRPTVSLRCNQASRLGRRGSMWGYLVLLKLRTKNCQ